MTNGHIEQRLKLYLASLGIPDPNAYHSLFVPDVPHSIALISNAWDNAPLEKSEPYIERTEQQIRNLDFMCRRIDLRDYRGRSTELQTTLQDFSGVWVTGGNSFYLNWLVAESGLGGILRHLFERGFVYGGESAGACIVGTTLHGVEALDNIMEAPTTIWEGMGLVPYGIVPHWGEPKYALYLERCRKEMLEFGEVKVITNNQYILVNDEPND